MTRLLKINQVMEMTTLSRSTIYRLTAQGKFVKPIKIGEKSTGYPLQEVEDFIQKRMEER